MISTPIRYPLTPLCFALENFFRRDNNVVKELLNTKAKLSAKVNETTMRQKHNLVR